MEEEGKVANGENRCFYAILSFPLSKGYTYLHFSVHWLFLQNAIKVVHSEDIVRIYYVVLVQGELRYPSHDLNSCENSCENHSFPLMPINCILVRFYGAQFFPPTAMAHVRPINILSEGVRDVLAIADMLNILALVSPITW